MKEPYSLGCKCTGPWDCKCEDEQDEFYNEKSPKEPRMTSEEILLAGYAEKIQALETQHEWLVKDSMQQLFGKDEQIRELVNEATMLRNVISELKAENATLRETYKFLKG